MESQQLLLAVTNIAVEWYGLPNLTGGPCYLAYQKTVFGKHISRNFAVFATHYGRFKLYSI